MRFCQGPDGARIAYTSLGAGRPLIMLLGWSTSFEAEWKDPQGRAWNEQIAADRRVIRCERRGHGTQQSDSPDLTLDAQAGDLLAIVDHLQVDEVDIFSAYDAAAVAATFATMHPQRVARLVLWSPFAHGVDVAAPEALDLITQLWLQNWQLARRTWAGQVFPSSTQERLRWYNGLLRDWFTPAVAASYMQFIRDIDVASVLSDVRAPTLVMARDGDRLVPATASRTAGALIGNTTFVSLRGDEGYPPFGDISYLGDMAAFLDEHAEPGPSVSPIGTVVILFVDIAGSTALTEQIGDAAFRQKARVLDDALRSIVRQESGAVIDAKTLGDGILATFPAASSAIAAALACASAGAAQGLPLHLGLHAGDVIRESNNIFGGAVNIAARISALAPPGDVLVSDIVRGLARTSAGVTFEDRGEQEMKGISEPVRVYAVRQEQ